MFKPFDGAMTAFRPVHPAIAVVTLALLTGCTAASVSAAGTSSSTAPAEVTPTTTAAATEADTTESAGTDAADASTADLGAVGTLDSTQVHEVSLSFDDADYQAMLDAYTSTGDKEWIEATVTIDGETYERAGIRLKGNSSLRSLLGGGRGPASRVSADDPTTLPWLIKLDEFVEDQQHNGLTELVVRSNNSSTALNEAVALELLDLAGLASQDAVATSFSVNGSEPVLRLVIENPDDAWMAEQLDASGALYKAESSGDYTYRGEDPQAYTEVFDQEAGDENADLTPLIELLDFVNNADDATFEAELESRLDVDSFATYLAMQELLANFDDIDGPGNNSYLYYDTETEQFTVVPWDYNLAFGTGPGGGPVVRGVAPGGGEMVPPAGGEMPAPPGGELPEGAVPGGTGEQGAPRGPAGRTNPLVQRFLAVDAWNTLYETRLEELRESLFGSGVAADVLAAWQDIVTSSGLVDADTVTSEASGIADQLS